MLSTKIPNVLKRERITTETKHTMHSAIINKEIEEVKDSIAEGIKISKNIHAEFLRLSDKAEKKRNFVAKS